MRPRLLCGPFGLLATSLALLATAASAQTPLGVFAEVENPGGLLQLADGRVLVEEMQGRILAFGSDGTPLSTFTDGADEPLVQLEDGRILASDDGRSGDVLVLGLDGITLSVFAPGLNIPTDAVQLADGRVLITEYGNGSTGRVSEFDADGTPRGRFARQLANPVALTQLQDGRVIVVEGGGRRVLAFAPDRTPLDDFIPPINGHGDVLQLPDGRVLLAGVFGSGIEDAAVSMFSPEGGYLGPFAAVGASGLALLEDGRVLTSSIETDQILAYGVVPVASEPSPEASGIGAVFPSPLAAGRSASVEVALEAPGAVRLAVFDALGRVVAEAEAVAAPGRQRLSVPTAGLAPGA